MGWKDDYMDVLQNLEFAVVTVWRQHREMTDYAATRAYEAAFECYRAEARGQQPKSPTLAGLDAEAFKSLKAVCEFRLGRNADLVDGEEKISPVPVGKLVDCLRELKKSAARHTKSGGRQGYLTFVDQYVR